MNYNLQNGEVSSGIGLINIQTISQLIESTKLNDMNWGVENCDVSGNNFYMNSHTIYEKKNHNYIYYTKKRDGNPPNLSAIENTGL